MNLGVSVSAISQVSKAGCKHDKYVNMRNLASFDIIFGITDFGMYLIKDLIINLF